MLDPSSSASRVLGFQVCSVSVSMHFLIRLADGWSLFFYEILSSSDVGLPLYKIPFFLSEARRGSERESLHLVGNGNSQTGVNETEIHIK